MDLADAMDLGSTVLSHESGHEEMAAVVRLVWEAAKAGPPDAATIQRIGGGWVGEEALGIGLLCALTADGGSPAGVADGLW